MMTYLMAIQTQTKTFNMSMYVYSTQFLIISHIIFCVKIMISISVVLAYLSGLLSIILKNDNCFT